MQYGLFERSFIWLMKIIQGLVMFAIGGCWSVCMVSLAVAYPVVMLCIILIWLMIFTAIYAEINFSWIERIKECLRKK